MSIQIIIIVFLFIMKLKIRIPLQATDRSGNQDHTNSVDEMANNIPLQRIHQTMKKYQGQTGDLDD